RAHPPAAMAQGEQLYRDNCAGCHGLDGAAHGPQAAASRVPAPDLQRPGSLVDQTDTQLLAVVTDGVAGTGMPGFGASLTESQRWAAVAWLRSLSLGGSEDGSAPTTPAPASAASLAVQASTAVADAHRLLDEALAARRRGGAAGRRSTTR